MPTSSMHLQSYTVLEDVKPVSFIYNLIKLYLTTVLLKMFYIPSTDILL